MIEAIEGTPGTLAAGKVTETGADGVRLAAGVTPNDLAVDHSPCGQYLLINCGDELVAMYGVMGGSVAAVEFADGGCYSVEELLDVIAGK